VFRRSRRAISELIEICLVLGPDSSADNGTNGPVATVIEGEKTVILVVEGSGKCDRSNGPPHTDRIAEKERAGHSVNSSTRAGRGKYQFLSDPLAIWELRIRISMHNLGSRNLDPIE
jgi:hypothetical protein